jgi:hypothetical protein
MIQKNVCSPNIQHFELFGGGFKFCFVKLVRAGTYELKRG